MKKTHNSRLFINMLSYLILQIVNLLVGMVLPRLYLAIYGSEVNGVISTINSFITYFSYLEAGLGLSLIHSLYKPLSQNDSDGINVILSYSQKQYQKISYIYLTLVVLLSSIFPFVSRVNDLSHIEFASLIFIIGFYGAFDFYSMAKYRVLLTADKKEYIISYAMIVAQVLRFVLTWIMLQFNISVVFVKIVPIITLFIRSIILKIYVEKKYFNVTFRSTSQTNTLTYKNRWDVLLLQISINTSTALPVLIVSQMLGYEDANVYAVFGLVINAVIAIVSALSSGVAPVFGEKIALKQNISAMYRVYEWGVSFALTLIFSVCSIMILPFVKLYVAVVDDINYVYPSYALLFSLWGALYSFRIPATAVINAAALYKENRATNIINLAIQIVLGMVLTYFGGMNGVLIAMIAAALHRDISMALTIDRKLMPNTFVRTVLHQVVICLIIVLSYYVGLLFVNIEQITVISWIVAAMASVVVLIIPLVIIYVFTDFKVAKGIFNRIKSKSANR